MRDCCELQKLRETTARNSNAEDKIDFELCIAVLEHSTVHAAHDSSVQKELQVPYRPDAQTCFVSRLNQKRRLSGQPW